MATTTRGSLVGEARSTCTRAVVLPSVQLTVKADPVIPLEAGALGAAKLAR